MISTSTPSGEIKVIVAFEGVTFPVRLKSNSPIIHPSSISISERLQVVSLMLLIAGPV